MAHKHRTPAQIWRRRWLYHPLQAALIYALLGLFRILPVGWASWLGSRLARTIAPLLAGPKRRARRTLDICFPDMAEEEKRTIERGMWDNLGRLAGEYPHLGRLWGDPGRVEIIGRERLEAARAAGKPILLVGGHIGNWELAAHGCGRIMPSAAVIYRAPNNRLLDPLLRRLRHAPGLSQFRKGSQAARESAKALRGGGTLALLVDQRLSSGIWAPFFGRPAMTAPAVAQFAIRFDAMILPVRVRRTRGARFQVIVEPPVELPDTGDRTADILAVTTRINEILEEWIRDRPEQWLWIHRRWRT